MTHDKMWRLLSCVLVLLVFGADCGPVGGPQDLVIFGRPRKVGEIYLLQVLKLTNPDDVEENEISDSNPSEDYTTEEATDVILEPSTVPSEQVSL